MQQADRTTRRGVPPAESSRLPWLVLSVVLAAVLTYITFAMSVGISCGAYNYGPNPGAEEAYCGYASGETRDFSAKFLLVQFIPAIPVLIGGVLPLFGHSRLYVAAGLGVGVLTTLVIWSVSP